MSARPKSARRASYLVVSCASPGRAVSERQKRRRGEAVTGDGRARRQTLQQVTSEAARGALRRHPRRAREKEKKVYRRQATVAATAMASIAGVSKTRQGWMRLFVPRSGVGSGVEWWSEVGDDKTLRQPRRLTSAVLRGRSVCRNPPLPVTFSPCRPRSARFVWPVACGPCATRPELTVLPSFGGSSLNCLRIAVGRRGACAAHSSSVVSRGHTFPSPGSLHSTDMAVRRGTCTPLHHIAGSHALSRLPGLPGLPLPCSAGLGTVASTPKKRLLPKP